MTIISEYRHPDEKYYMNKWYNILSINNISKAANLLSKGETISKSITVFNTINGPSCYFGLLQYGIDGEGNIFYSKVYKLGNPNYNWDEYN